jgi:hypothetical protein
VTAISIIFIILASFGLLTFCCQVCSTTCLQIFQFLKFLLDLMEETRERSFMIRNLCQNITRCTYLMMNILNVLGPATMLTCGILLSNPNFKETKTIGVISITFGSIYILYNLVTILVFLYISCCGFVCASLAKEKKKSMFNYRGNMYENEYD